MAPRSANHSKPGPSVKRKKEKPDSQPKQKASRTLSQKIRVGSNVRDKSESNSQHLYWVGIGASAGGLEALQDLVSAITADPKLPLTFLIAQHLSPTHRSMLVQILSRHSLLKIEDVLDGTIPEAGKIYITPPNTNLVVEHGQLRLRPPVSELSPKPSVDILFDSLAECVGDHAIGIILSGTGSDGAHGVRAIRAAGGLTIAQEPGSAKYDSMPRKAIETRCIDLIVKPAEMFSEIKKQIPSQGSTASWIRVNDSEQVNIQELIFRLKKRSGVDFSEYKVGTLYRRIDRQMAACGATSLEEYFEAIDHDPQKLDQLFRDILINVTSFFRDGEAFDAARKVAAEILSAKEANASIRVWVAGCSTGEEAYSLAILFSEAAGGVDALIRNYKFQIFATDIDQEALVRARKGAYSEVSLAFVNPEIRSKYFTMKDGCYEVIKAVRGLVVFSVHNVFEDPPFLRLDLISCRNLLIYFNPKLQQKVFELFHYALSIGGVLFLGKSESLGQASSLFVAHDTRCKIFKPKRVAGIQSFRQSFATLSEQRQTSVGVKTASRAALEISDAFIEALAPDSVLIDEGMEVIRIFGDVRAYTELSAGAAPTNLMAIARKEVRQELRGLVYKISRDEKRQAVKLPKRLITAGELHQVDIVIRPLSLKNSAERLLLVSFEKVMREPITASDASARDERVASQIEQELVATREHLQTVVEELETSNEELQSTNEELQSSNEELQSSNEELETANEELQSTNEELLTVNEELHIKSSELAATNEDLGNIKESIDDPLVVVDLDSKLRRFNAAAQRVFILTESSIGESLFNLKSHIELPDLRDKIEGVIKSGGPFTEQIDTPTVCYYLRILPYRSSSAAVQGVVITFIDNSSERRSLEQLQRSERRYDLAVRGSSWGIWEWDIASDDMYWSPLLAGMLTGRSRACVVKFRDFERRIHPEDLANVMAILDAHLERDFAFDVEFRVRRDSGECLWVDSRGQVERDAFGECKRMAGSIYDISERQEAIEKLTQSNQALERFAYVCSHDLKEPVRIIDNFITLFMKSYGSTLDDKGRHYLTHVQNSSQRVQGMIRDILTYSQLEYKSLDMQEVDCNVEIARVIDNLQLTVKESGAAINVGNLPKIWADRIQIFQLFQNLLGNGLKFCRDKKPEISVVVNDQGDSWEFIVVDNGIGIAPEDATKIFGVFKRLHTREEFPGNGIGLSICQQVVRRHGGEIWVKSKKGEGSSFHFTISKRFSRRKSHPSHDHATA